MKIRNIAPVAACAFLGALAQALAGLVGAWAAYLCGAGLAVACFFLLRFFEVEFKSWWMQAGVPAGASLLGVLFTWIGAGGHFTQLPWLAPVLAGAVALAAAAIRRSGSRRCGLCDMRIGSGVAFTCPRCELLVCERCWEFDHCRCRLCEQNRVPLFPQDGRWWDKRFGPRSPYGRCQYCEAGAQEANLRDCGKCGRPHCRECWDYLNGQCSRCDWRPRELPERLLAYLPASTAPEPPGRQATY